MLPNKENITAKAVSPGWRNDGMGQEFRGKREGRNAANQQGCPGDTSTKAKFLCDLGESSKNTGKTMSPKSRMCLVLRTAGRQ